MIKKRKSSFNIIDALVILLAAALLLGAYFLFFRRNSDKLSAASKPLGKIEYVLQVSALPAEYSDNIKVGESVIDSESGDVIGRVGAVDFESYVHVGYDKTTGEQRLTPSAELVNLYITVESDSAFVRDNLCYVEDTSIYIEKKLSLMMPDLFCTASCISLDVTE